MAVLRVPRVTEHYIGDTADTKPTGVAIGSTYLDRQTGILYVTYDGTNWVAWNKVAQLTAGTSIVGKFGIDQTTDGTTNAVNVKTSSGAGATIGVTTGAAVVTDATGTLQQYLRGLVKLVAAKITVGIDQATAHANEVAVKRVETSASVTIANNETTSGAVTAGGATVFGLILPAAFTGTSVSFMVCSTIDGTYAALYDKTGTLVEVSVTQGCASELPAELAAWPFWKIVSDASEGGERVLTIVAKG